MDDNDVLRRAVLDAVTLPSRLDHGQVVKEPVADAVMASCGCVLSGRLVDSMLRPDDHFDCPVCGTGNATTGHAVEQLRKLFETLGFVEDHKNMFTDISPIASTAASTTKKESLMSLFYSIANSVNQEPPSPHTPATEPPSDPHPLTQLTQLTQTKVIEFKKSQRHSDASASSTISNSTLPLMAATKQNTNSMSSLPPSTRQSSSAHSSSLHTPPSLPHPTQQPTTTPTTTSAPTIISSEPYQEHKEYLFVKCFPTYRRHFQFNTHSKFLKAKSKTFIQCKISPSCKYFVLLSPKKWEVYEISTDSARPPQLYCCGKSNGEFGHTFENLEKPPMNEIRNGNVNTSDFLKKLSDWEHLYCSLSDSMLVISGTNGIFRVFDMALRGRPIYLYSSNFPIRCIDISPNSQLIAYGITGKDRLSGTEQALIVMHKFLFDGEMLFKVDPVTITFPYRDPINTISFSSDSTYLSCSTAMESRFLTVLVKDADRPKLVMKSMRSLDTSLESEGITDIKMFENNRYMCVTSLAFGAPPIIIDNSIALTNGLQTVAQPKLLLKLDEVGTNIHSCAVSPRNDSVALLDRNGTVYLMATTMKMDQESKRVFIVDQVNHAFRARESASIAFSKDGHRLYIVDRKGILYVNDFAAGTPQNAEITRCKPLVRD